MKLLLNFSYSSFEYCLFSIKYFFQFNPKHIIHSSQFVHSSQNIKFFQVEQLLQKAELYILSQEIISYELSIKADHQISLELLTSYQAVV
ncbi:TPA: hypothetical protein DEG21_01575 [Patescibacteria group bacterium]|nr:hypothetical protein [Candidatus Gracilibacteria bacterium]HBY74580.1 hypothetical protein [Candidatus Gracilibacteria bacterium]